MCFLITRSHLAPWEHTVSYQLVRVRQHVSTKRLLTSAMFSAVSGHLFCLDIWAHLPTFSVICVSYIIKIKTKFNCCEAVIGEHILTFNMTQWNHFPVTFCEKIYPGLVLLCWCSAFYHLIGWTHLKSICSITVPKLPARCLHHRPARTTNSSAPSFTCKFYTNSCAESGHYIFWYGCQCGLICSKCVVWACPFTIVAWRAPFRAWMHLQTLLLSLLTYLHFERSFPVQ